MSVKQTSVWNEKPLKGTMVKVKNIILVKLQTNKKAKLNIFQWVCEKIKPTVDSLTNKLYCIQHNWINWGLY